MNRALSTLRLLFNYAERCGYRVSNPVKNVEFFSETGRERIISLVEEREYMASASQPLKDIARIILDTGMRPEEVFRIERVSVDIAQRTIMNPFGKTKAARRKLTMTEEVWTIMNKRAGSSDSKYVFPSPANPDRQIGSVRKAHDGAVRRSKVQPAFRLYDLRHTYATRAVMAGVDLPTLGALLGHTTIQMTMRYAFPSSRRAQTRSSAKNRNVQGFVCHETSRGKSDGHYNFHYSAMKAMKTTTHMLLRTLVRGAGFEPGASCRPRQARYQAALRPDNHALSVRFNSKALRPASATPISIQPGHTSAPDGPPRPFLLPRHTNRATLL